MDVPYLCHKKWRIEPTPGSAKTYRLLTHRGREICTIHFTKKVEPKTLQLIDMAPALQRVAEFQALRLVFKNDPFFNSIRTVLRAAGAED